MYYYNYYVDYFLLFFFFKQKTAYEMRISDWSSDVCSSDLQAKRRFDVAEHQGRRAVGDERAVGALQRPGHHRVLVGDVAAELVAEVLAHLRQRIGHAVAVVPCGNGGHRVRLAAVLPDILPVDAAEDPGHPPFDLADRLQVGRLTERVGGLVAGQA